MRSMIGHVRDMLNTYRSDVITPIVLQPDMVYANLWALHHSYSFHSIRKESWNVRHMVTNQDCKVGRESKGFHDVE